MTLTHRDRPARIDREASQEAGIRAAANELVSRLKREFRYTPELTGNVAIIVHCKRGIPLGLTIKVEDGLNLSPIEER